MYLAVCVYLKTRYNANGRELTARIGIVIPFRARVLPIMFTVPVLRLIYTFACIIDRVYQVRSFRDAHREAECVKY